MSFFEEAVSATLEIPEDVAVAFGERKGVWGSGWRGGVDALYESAAELFAESKGELDESVLRQWECSDCASLYGVKGVFSWLLEHREGKKTLLGSYEDDLVDRWSGLLSRWPVGEVGFRLLCLRGEVVPKLENRVVALKRQEAEEARGVSGWRRIVEVAQGKVAECCSMCGVEEAEVAGVGLEKVEEVVGKKARLVVEEMEESIQRVLGQEEALDVVAKEWWRDGLREESGVEEEGVVGLCGRKEVVGMLEALDARCLGILHPTPDPPLPITLSPPFSTAQIEAASTLSPLLQSALSLLHSPSTTTALHTLSHLHSLSHALSSALEAKAHAKQEAKRASLQAAETASALKRTKAKLSNALAQLSFCRAKLTEALQAHTKATIVLKPPSQDFWNALK